jgi:Mlc titration factor MtfA (ptsG expression regulator)
MGALIWIAVTALLIAVPLWWPRWRLQRALSRPLAPALLVLLERNVPLYAGLPTGLQAQLRRLVVQFLYQKKFVGCGGLVVTDEMRVTVAALACLLLLNRPTGVYPLLHAVLLYPDQFVVPRASVGPGGVVTPDQQDLLGESWDDGRVLLSWQDVPRGVPTGSGRHNVVLHEFAHQLDTESGAANGAPYLGSAARYRAWAAVLSRDFASLQRDAWYDQPSVLDHYGATSPAEFFAVATEAFFDDPHRMAHRHADLYGEFRKYYRVDPRAWQAAPADDSGAAAASAALHGHGC